MYFKADGKVTACCRNDVDLFGMIENKSLTDLWNSESIDILRKNILDYNLNDGCNYCNNQLASSNFNAFEGRLYDDWLAVKLKKFPTEMTFEISNQCNLECIMCDGNYSSSIRMNREKLPPLANRYPDNFIQTVKEGIPYLKVVRFLGGEPFLISQYIEIIEEIISVNPKCKIYIQTNGTILNNRVKKIITHKNIHLSISIDSLKKNVYETIRKNASFERLMEHLQIFIESAKTHHNIININFCVMTNNWQEIIDMLEFCNKNKFTLTYIPVEFPRYLSLRSLNASTLNEILLFLSKTEHYQLVAKNKFNGDKLMDLINYIKHCKTHAVQLKTRADELYTYNAESLITELIKIMKGIAIQEHHINSIISIISSIANNLPEIERPFFLGSIVLDVEQNPNETPIFHHKTSKDWDTLFVAYLNNLLNCSNKTVYI